MVASEQEYVLGILHLIGQNKTNGLQRHLTSVYTEQRKHEIYINSVSCCILPIHIVAQEEKISVGRISNFVKVSQQVFILSVQVSTDDQRCLQL